MECIEIFKQKVNSMYYCIFAKNKCSIFGDTILYLLKDPSNNIFNILCLKTEIKTLLNDLISENNGNLYYILFLDDKIVLITSQIFLIYIIKDYSLELCYPFLNHTLNSIIYKCHTDTIVNFNDLTNFIHDTGVNYIYNLDERRYNIMTKFFPNKKFNKIKNEFISVKEIEAFILLNIKVESKNLNFYKSLINYFNMIKDDNLIKCECPIFNDINKIDVTNFKKITFLEKKLLIDLILSSDNY